MKQHYHLASTEVAFLEPENQQIGMFKLNVLHRSKSINVASADLARIQQIAQLQFFEKLENPNLIVKDVFFIGISYLGNMTEEEFQKPPEGHTVQERKAPETDDGENPFSG